MKTVRGDLIALAKLSEFDVIVHGCNCFCTMGAGIAKLIRQEFPQAYAADLATTKGDSAKLGTYSMAQIQLQNATLQVINGYTQYNWRGVGVKADYDAIARLFAALKKDFAGKRIGYPLIGAGLAGGDWNQIAAIINEQLAGEDHTLVVLP
jgi:O-acetyl-ADP-ribose deacetylase (regulator of RNase III)